MNCERFQTVASELARHEIRRARGNTGSPTEHLSSGAIPAGVVVMGENDRASALAHIDECERCREMWDDQRELSEALRIVAERMKTLQAPVQLEERLRQAFRDRTLALPSGFTPPRWRYWAGAAAAALLIVSGLMIWRFHAGSLPQSQAQANSKTGTSPPAQAAKPDQSPVFTGGSQIQHDSVLPDKPAVDHRLAKARLARPAHDGAAAKLPTTDAASGLAVSTETKEVTTDFVALGYGSALDLQDGGQLVRVELPRSALARFGLPMNMDRADERVKADVLVAADGLARAIRFVK